jgi:capsule polysaccharide export protein KpsE/RkpR
VIIPEELRIPLPGVVVHQQPSPARSKRLIWVIIAFVLVIVVAVCVTASIIVNRSNQSTTDNTASFDSGSVTSTALSGVDSATATVEAKATLDALQPILKLEQSWPASFTDTFTDNRNKWSTGDVRDSYITGNQSISSGTYTWNITCDGYLSHPPVIII